LNDGLELEDVVMVMVVEVMKLTLERERVLTDANLVQKFSHVRRI
jgi:hypothetical protein